MRVCGASAGAAVSSFLIVIALAGCGSSGGAGSGTAGTGGGGAGSGGGPGIGGSGGGAGAGGGAGTTGGGGMGGGPVVGDQGIVLTIGTQVIEYREEPFAYAGRPPLLEIWARNGTEGTFRIMVAPETGGTTIVPGTTYPCRTGGTYLTLMRAGKQYDTYNRTGGSCSVTVTEAGYGAGDRFSGTFSGTLIGLESGGVEVKDGSFFGLLTL